MADPRDRKQGLIDLMAEANAEQSWDEELLVAYWRDAGSLSAEQRDEIERLLAESPQAADALRALENLDATLAAARTSSELAAHAEAEEREDAGRSDSGGTGSVGGAGDSSPILLSPRKPIWRQPAALALAAAIGALLLYSSFSSLFTAPKDDGRAPGSSLPESPLVQEDSIAPIAPQPRADEHAQIAEARTGQATELGEAAEQEVVPELAVEHGSVPELEHGSASQLEHASAPELEPAPKRVRGPGAEPERLATGPPSTTPTVSDEAASVESVIAESPSSEAPITEAADIAAPSTEPLIAEVPSREVHTPEAPTIRAPSSEASSIAGTLAGQAIAESFVPTDTPAPKPVLLAMAMPTYVAPPGASPRPRITSVVRGQTGGPELALLLPEHVARTMHAQPSLYWKLDGVAPAGARVGFVVTQKRAAEPLAAGDLHVSSESTEPGLQPGLQRIALAQHGASLVPGVEYRWTVFVRGENQGPDRDAIAQGWIRFDPPGADLSAELAASTDPSERIGQLAGEGYWLDALDELMQLRDDYPDDARVQTAVTELLGQVGLAR